MVKKLYMASTSTFVVNLMNELVEKFCKCRKWSGRQTFVFICQVKCFFIHLFGFVGVVIRMKAGISSWNSSVIY